ncbi:MAG TPA: hypothetical protein DCZ72_10280 [Armatimonadetes bacterium]|nr:hypothetical protein [Armatimonadota bacterium]
MTSKERVLTTFARREADRVPINYSANADIDARLKAHFGLAPGDHAGLLGRLGVDFRGVGAPYTGPQLFEQIEGRHIDLWGIHRRWVEHPTGGYWDYCDFPLREADVDTVATWPMPDPDHYDYSQVAAHCRAQGEFAVHVGDPGLACIINTAGFLRGMEQALVDLLVDDEAGLLLVDRMLDQQYEVTRRVLAAAEGGVDFMWIGEDLGTQIGPLISHDIFTKHVRPRHQRFIDLAQEYGLPVMIHTCGSSSWAYDDYAEMGVGVVDTLQPEARDMAPAYLKERYGDRLAFHGCISTAGPVATGTVDETIADCEATLATMMPGGGYCFAPTHALQDNSPTENVVAMYETAWRAGRYG